MHFTRTRIHDVIIFEPKIFSDDRGYFVETFRQETCEKFIGSSVLFCQDNESKSNRGVLRGLHYQLEPMAQAKLVRVIQGRVLDVAVDIRKNSPTFGLHVCVELSGENKKQMFIPRGFAHGFVVLEDDTIFVYKADNYYSPEHDRGILYDDPALSIDWGMDKSELQLSAKDIMQPLFKDAQI